MQVQTRWEKEVQEFLSLSEIQKDKYTIDVPVPVPVGGFRYTWIGHTDDMNRYHLRSGSSYLSIYNQDGEIIRTFFRT